MGNKASHTMNRNKLLSCGQLLMKVGPLLTGQTDDYIYYLGEEEME
jgi:hypothetical protein